MGQGSLKIQLEVADYALHGNENTVYIKKDGRTVYALETDRNGSAETVELEAPDITAGSPSSGTSLFETYDVYVPASHGFLPVNVYGVQIFDKIPSVLDIQLEPYVEGGPTEKDIYIPLEHAIDIGRDNTYQNEAIIDSENSAEPYGVPPLNHAYSGQYAPSARTLEPFAPATIAPSNVPLANQVVIPEYITVHLGAPNTNAASVRVNFIDYIANVASSEIYPHWHVAAIEANIHAQVSLALNRLFTHWYPSQGKTFDIVECIKNLTTKNHLKSTILAVCPPFLEYDKLSSNIF
ncbi:MAG: hypothetical protein FWG87_11390 [Defluviitaleaceae bacterium]|nr:hypothetical protein [Defluviitaleaceae bacterium]